MTSVAVLSIISGIVGSVVGVVAVLVIQEFIAQRRARRGVFSGVWDQVVPEQGGEPERHDNVCCRHIGNTVSGSIVRQRPLEQRHKVWRFRGQVRGSLVFATFWPTDPAKNPGSYGTIQLHMINEKQLKGFYVKLRVTSEEDRFTGELRQCQLKWVRKP